MGPGVPESSWEIPEWHSQDGRMGGTDQILVLTEPLDWGRERGEQHQIHRAGCGK